MKDWCEDYSSSFTRKPLQRKTLFWIFIVSILTLSINEFFYYKNLLLGRRPSNTASVSTGKSVCIALYSYYFIDSQLWDKGVSLTLHMRGKCVSPHHNGQGAVRPDRRSKKICHSLDFRFWFLSFKNENLFLAPNNYFWPWDPGNMDKGVV